MSPTISLKPPILRQACQEMGGDLASLAKNKEQDSIWPFLPKDNSIYHGYWIGGIRKTVVGSHPTRKHWLWLTGEPIPNIHNIDGIDGYDCAAYYKLKGHLQASVTGEKCNEKCPGHICQHHSNLLQFALNSI